MPHIDSNYRAPWGFSGGHVQTIFPALFRRVPMVRWRRERLVTPDADFIDLDWHTEGDRSRLAILSHGLEGDTTNTYIQGMARALIRAGWDVLAWNFRGCSGEPNRLLRSYHSGATEDLAAVITHVPARYTQLALVGFSLGGNITLKYLGEPFPDPRISGAVAFSVPCDLASSAHRLASLVNRVYMKRFLRSLRAKVREKMIRFPGRIDGSGLDAMRTFREFDHAYTAPMNGFSSAEDYWRRASSKPALRAIRIPTLLVNARNDPFLPDACFPIEEARENEHFHLETPASGGHVGFVSFNAKNEYWSESRAVEFLAA